MKCLSFRIFFKTFLLWVVCVCWSACGSGNSSGTAQSSVNDSDSIIEDTDFDTSPGNSTEEDTDTGPRDGADYDAAFVFDDNVLRTYELTLPEGEWESLQENALDKVYVRATLAVDNELVGDVGLRFKGGWTLESCFEGGRNGCEKMSLKVKFDEYDENMRWHGLKKLNFNAGKVDGSMMHDRLAYQIFREMNVVASYATHARVVVNGEYYGLFSLVEAVDGRFTDNRFVDNGDGDLYKEAWPHTEDSAYFEEGIRTNEDTATHELIVQFSNELQSASWASLPDVLEKWVDGDYLLRYMAVDSTLAHWDGITAFYCRDGENCENHNFYLYQEEHADRFVLIPWDMDATFSPNDPFISEGVPRWNEPPGECNKNYNVFNIDIQEPACDPLIRGVALLGSERYKAALQQLLDGPFVVEEMTADIDRWAVQIEDAVADDPTMNTWDWEDAVWALKQDLGALRERTESWVDAL